MKGSVTMPESLVCRQAPLLETGVYYIEIAGWGKAAFDKIPEKSIVLTYTDGQDERDDFGEDLTGGKGGGGDDGGDDDIPKATKKQPLNTHINVTEDCIIRNNKGDVIAIDFTKLPSQSNGVDNTSVHKKKKSRKQPIYHRKSYIKEKTTTNDNKIDVAKKYDKSLEKGDIKEVRLPKPDRNDKTTDEIDK